MTLTSKQIQEDFTQFVRRSELITHLSGGVYKRGYRPRDSRLEDVVVSFTTGTAGQIQTGVITYNIYVPDIDPNGNGIYVEDGARTAEIERLAQLFVDTLTASESDYIITLRQTIYTEELSDNNQHFVVIILDYKYADDEV